METLSSQSLSYPMAFLFIVGVILCLYIGWSCATHWNKAISETKAQDINRELRAMIEGRIKSIEIALTYLSSDIPKTEIHQILNAEMTRLRLR